MKINAFWFRRDLRLHDNAALYHALKAGKPVFPVFIFDQNILDKLEDKDDARVFFIHSTLLGIHKDLSAAGVRFVVKYGEPQAVWTELSEAYELDTVYTNRDYEPYALWRDGKVAAALKDRGVQFKTFKDQVIFEHNEVLKQDGDPYTVFTPYSRKWKEKLGSQKALYNGQNISFFLKPYPVEKYTDNFFKGDKLPVLNLEDMGFKPSKIEIPSKEVPQKIISNYDQTRNFPGIEGTSKLGIHFRFGTISIREKALKARSLNETYLNELIWRDFYSQILANFPHVAERSFRQAYDHIDWRNNEEEFAVWCAGKTGYPLVDAGMRELNQTGYMHNRVRMVTASFLTKLLLIDWRWGEAYFARKLLDFDLASNNGGWQWAAGSGTDAAPYFRIFNPETQMVKFDKDKKYIKKWVPEYGTDKYPKPIVEHKFARERCLETYKAALK